MIGAILLAAQAASAESPKCDTPEVHDIVVCGSRGERQSPYRLPKLTNEYDRPKLKAQIKLGSGAVTGHVEKATAPGGWDAPRVMFTFGIPF